MERERERETETEIRMTGALGTGMGLERGGEVVDRENVRRGERECARPRERESERE